MPLEMQCWQLVEPSEIERADGCWFDWDSPMSGPVKSYKHQDLSV